MKGDLAASDSDIASAKKIDPTIGDKFVKWGVPPPIN
jgi:hypothetical protein